MMLNYLLSLLHNMNKRQTYKHFQSPLTALSAVGALRALIDFTLSNTRRFYSSMGSLLSVKGLIAMLLRMTKRGSEESFHAFHVDDLTKMNTNLGFLQPRYEEVPL